MLLADILLIVLIADAAQNGMAGEYKSVSEAMVLVGTIAAWNYLRLDVLPLPMVRALLRTACTAAGSPRPHPRR